MFSLEKIIKRFRRDDEYIVFFENGKTVYNIISPELKQVIFADEAKRGVNVAESNCLVEVDNEGNERKTLVVSGGEVNVTLPSSSRNYDYSSSLSSLPPKPQLLFKSFLDNVQIPTYDESGRLLTDPVEIEAEVEKRRNGQRKGDYWKKEWEQISFGKLENIPSSSKIEEIDVLSVPLIQSNQDQREIEDNKERAETISNQEYHKSPYWKK